LGLVIGGSLSITLQKKAWESPRLLVYPKLA
jgi:hypothetical protein